MTLLVLVAWMKILTQQFHDQKFLDNIHEVPSNRTRKFVRIWAEYRFMCRVMLICVVIRGDEIHTLSLQKWMSLKQRAEHKTRTRSSRAFGGATMISSITNGSPAFLATAAASNKQSKYTSSSRFMKQLNRHLFVETSIHTRESRDGKHRIYYLTEKLTNLCNRDHVPKKLTGTTLYNLRSQEKIEIQRFWRKTIRLRTYTVNTHNDACIKSQKTNFGILERLTDKKNEVMKKAELRKEYQ